MSDTVTLTLHIENRYEDDMVVTTATITVPAPPDEGTPAYDEWAEDHIYAETGTGRADGDSWYNVEIKESTDPTLVGRTFEWGY